MNEYHEEGWDDFFALAVNVLSMLQDRQGADISQKTLMILDQVDRPIHYTNIASIIRQGNPGKECSDTSVSAALTTWVRYGMVERSSGREGMYTIIRRGKNEQS